MHSFPDRALIHCIDLDYQKLSGKLLPSPKNLTDRSWWLHHEAPYSILAHNNDSDPHFIYANQCALKCFEYSREEILQLPSRLSAAASEQQERQQLLDVLANKDIIHGYSGVRITREGKTFNIYNGVIWQLKNDDGELWGQGALFWLSPNASEHNFDA
ncbi:MEKHLA domain-containing protein [Pectobacterium carotovorum]|uniref:MEKHLA domain protein n=1 Tax=Pectobacterium carotovorum TaxID=554 RepID=A0A0N9N071_PECCA|nr:MEKHLA domain-containing protein [Pectobacterium carotovorum]ALG88636.1 MEKHLA domain protein [Pectobacterium carotovorum]